MSDKANEPLPPKQIDKIWRRIYFVVLAILIFGLGILVGARLKNESSSSAPALNPGQSPISLPAKLDSLPITANSIANISAAAQASVVDIDSRPLVEQVPGQPLNFFGGSHVANGQNYPEQPISPAQGAGLIISADGYVLTTTHILHNGSSIEVRLNDQRVLPAKLIGRDSFSDLAVVKVDAHDLPVAKSGSGKSLRAGDWVAAIGSPPGFGHSVTVGTVSALSRSMNDSAPRSRVDLIQINAAINPANFGGPLLNMKGEVVAINTSIRGEAQNTSFAIPIEDARKVAAQLIKGGDLARPYLGIFMQDIDSFNSKALGLPTNVRGVLISQIMRGGPCEAAGLAVGDVLQKVQGVDVVTPADVRKITRSMRPGQALEVLVWRKGTTQTRKISIGKYPDEF